jgi:hypothetical protein
LQSKLAAETRLAEEQFLELTENMVPKFVSKNSDTCDIHNHYDDDDK